MGRLGHAVGFDHRTFEHVVQLFEYGRRKRRRRGADQPQTQTLGSIRLALGAEQDGLVHGRHAGIPADLFVARLVEEFQGVEPAGAADRSALRHAGGENRDQPVDMEQRHDVQAVVAVGQLEAGGDIACRCHDIALHQRHNLGPRCGAGCVKDERLVVGAGRSRICLGLEQPEGAGRVVVADHCLDHRDRQRAGRGTDGVLASRLDDDQLRRKVLKVEGVFTFLIGGVERGSRHICRDCHKG